MTPEEIEVIAKAAEEFPENAGSEYWRYRGHS